MLVSYFSLELTQRRQNRKAWKSGTQVHKKTCTVINEGIHAWFSVSGNFRERSYKNKVTICVRQGFHILSISFLKFLKPFHFLTVQFLTWPRYVPDQLALKKMIDEIGQGTERSDDQIVDVLKREQSGRKMILNLNE